MSFVLLNKDGTLDRKLHLVSLPDDYEIPLGKIVSWKTTDVHWVTGNSSSRPFWLYEEGKMLVPPEIAHFHYGSAWAEVSWGNLERQKSRDGYRMTLVVTVQGTAVRDITYLRGRILHLIHTQSKWLAYNDLNPEPHKPRFGLRGRLKQLWFGDQVPSKAVSATCR